ncbi:FkbM family methyltransferase [Chitinophaga sp. sic0106]|uniref:FkbM family methyltransferase n=1 Tax=Chitinophaga sp. sic0106 TaxID=2854785 RepID=UPI001C461419|nr:FkbM family methyltransferase [Chitinophaga sp. sic0106]MBV7528997.1 FkbM family methyltransferase [Chitinophaga sp. sic0106]
MDKKIIDQFQHATTFEAKNRWVKMLNKPVQFVHAFTCNKLSKAQKVKATTFWGGNMEVVIPEVVSSEIYKHGYFDKEVCYYLLRVLAPGDVFVDIGAHFGFFSLMANNLVKDSGTVVSIDPTPSTFQLLSSNLNKFAPFKNFKLFNNAAFEREEELNFYDFGVKKSAFNSLFGSRLEKMDEEELRRHQIRVKALPVDNVIADLGLSKITLIKIDAESAEMNVLKGLEKTILEFKPMMILEIGDTDVADAVATRTIIDFLIRFNYVPVELNEQENLQIHEIRNNYSLDQLTCYNLLFVHKDKVARLLS